jgi:cell division protein FtsB
LNLSIAQNRAVILAALAAAAAILFFPAQQFLQQRHQISTVQASLTKLHAEDNRLAAESKRLSDPNELALLARQRLGLVRPGERAYFIEPTEVPRHPATAPAATGTVASHRSSFGRAWHWLTSLLRGRN